jgi:phosphoglucomutase
MVAHLRQRIAEFNAAKAAAGGGVVASSGAALPGGYVLATADEFSYTDPVDGSVSSSQGLRFIMADGSRVVYRLSGTGSVGATVRVYIEKYEPDAARHDTPTAEALAALVDIAVNAVGRIEHFTGRAAPTVIT